MGVVSLTLMTNKRKRDAEDDEYVDNGDTSFSYREDEFSAEMDDDVGRKVIASDLFLF